ncbi:carbohydrate ABC transporter permease [Vibrio algarum]|uniref:Sugar ABC transporter permease n=1 Tax=Vibrio algarum TaxID=3020714 RepID=A0ABT4YWE9_9VIBR|nr:sugar ABC transporter permease [Vibrio sp. KJ40-1]MDB1125339.1 sugar ABC transporter permease [Vibrio sp. KJ40-1]
MFNFSLRQQQRLIVFAFLAIPLSLLFTFSYYPASQLFYMSVTDWDGYAPVKNFIGLENYTYLWEDPEQLNPMLVSLYYFAGAVIQLSLSLWFAVLVNSKLAGRNLFKTLLFVPFVLNAVAASMVFQIFYQVDGALDSFLSAIGLESLIRPWLMDSDVVNWALVAASIWRYLGFNLILFFGVLQSIPQDQYEAAQIEGANEWQQFRLITLPSIKLVIGLQVLLAFVGSLSSFEIPMIITKGANGTKTFVMATLETAFNFNDFGMASTMAVLLLMIVIMFMILQKVLFKEEK